MNTFKQGKTGGVRFTMRLQKVLMLWAHYILTLNVTLKCNTNVHVKQNNTPYFYHELIQSDEHTHQCDKNYLK